MTKNELFFSKTEKADWELLQAFNEHTHIFDELQQTEDKYHTDGTGYTTTGIGEARYWNIELKNRNLILLEDWRISGCTDKGKEFVDDTLFIESHKVADMVLDTINGVEPIYVNFLANGYTAIFNLSKLTMRPKKTATMNIKSKGYNKFEVSKRQGLYLKDAAIWDNNYRLIKRAGDDFRQRATG